MARLNQGGKVNELGYLIDAVHNVNRGGNKVYPLKSEDGDACLMDVFLAKIDPHIPKENRPYIQPDLEEAVTFAARAYAKQYPTNIHSP